MSHSTGAQRKRKPRVQSPPWKHPNGQWCKKIKSKVYYFGTISADPTGTAALKLWAQQESDLRKGHKPRPKDDDELTVVNMLDKFLVAKAQQRDVGEITPLTWANYKHTCDRMVKLWGNTRAVNDLRPDDFEQLRAKFGEGRGIIALGNEIVRARVAFKYAFDAGLIPAPMRFGPLFKRPGRKVLRRLRAKQTLERGVKKFMAADILRLIDTATPTLKAMMLLAINCGLGNSDLAYLPLTAIDLKTGWLDFPRPKTGIERKCKLWPQTVQAIKAYLAKRRPPKDEANAGLVFITAARGSFTKQTSDSPITKEFAKLVKGLGLKQTGRGFYSLRHTYRTVAGGACDLEAIRFTMGHVNEHVEDAYIQRIDDARLERVADHVRKWLFRK